jgi:hypothetical protein
MRQPFIGFKKAYDSVRWEDLLNIIIYYGFIMKLLKVIKMFLN